MKMQLLNRLENSNGNLSTSTWGWWRQWSKEHFWIKGYINEKGEKNKNFKFADLQLILTDPFKVGTDKQYFQNKTQAQIP